MIIPVRCFTCGKVSTPAAAPSHHDHLCLLLLSPFSAGSGLGECCQLKRLAVPLNTPLLCR